MSTLLELAAFALAAVATRRGFGVTAAEFVAAGELLVVSLGVDDAKVGSVVRGFVVRRVVRGFVVRRVAKLVAARARRAEPKS